MLLSSVEGANHQLNPSSMMVQSDEITQNGVLNGLIWNQGSLLPISGLPPIIPYQRPLQSSLLNQSRLQPSQLKHLRLSPQPVPQSSSVVMDPETQSSLPAHELFVDQSLRQVRNSRQLLGSKVLSLSAQPSQQ